MMTNRLFRQKIFKERTINDSFRNGIIILLIGFLMAPSISLGEGPEQSFQWTLEQWKPYTHKAPDNWPLGDWIGLNIDIPAKIFKKICYKDPKISQVSLDTTRFDINDLESFYRAITHVELKPEGKFTSLVEAYIFKEIKNELSIPFKIYQPDFIEFIIRNNAYFISIHRYTNRINSDSSDILPDGRLNNNYKIYLLLPENSPIDQLIKELETKEYIFRVNKATSPRRRSSRTPTRSNIKDIDKLKKGNKNDSGNNG